MNTKRDIDRLTESLSLNDGGTSEMGGELPFQS